LVSQNSGLQSHFLFDDMLLHYEDICDEVAKKCNTEI